MKKFRMLYKNTMSVAEYVLECIFYYMVSSIAFVFLCVRKPSWISRDDVVVFMIAFSAALMMLEIIATIKHYRNITTVFLNIIIAYGVTAFVMYAERFPFLVMGFGILFVAFVDSSGVMVGNTNRESP